MFPSITSSNIDYPIFREAFREFSDQIDSRKEKREFIGTTFNWLTDVSHRTQKSVAKYGIRINHWNWIK